MNYQRLEWCKHCKQDTWQYKYQIVKTQPPKWFCGVCKKKVKKNEN